LSLENTLWANTVLASGRIIALVIFTGKETRMTMSSTEPRTKVGRLDKELNLWTKLLFIFLAFLGLILTFLKGFNG